MEKPKLFFGLKQVFDTYEVPEELRDAEPLTPYEVKGFLNERRTKKDEGKSHLCSESIEKMLDYLDEIVPEKAEEQHKIVKKFKDFVGKEHVSMTNFELVYLVSLLPHTQREAMRLIPTLERRTELQSQYHSEIDSAETKKTMTALLTNIIRVLQDVG
ncbi:RNA polymerase subunit RPB4/RPC9 like protein [Aduncisulcus paluster]|uniref:RNA polymerase subunit RPB4/RPC9 like protein n=1 Tax=Aduncisulcus paluster TaxID=2918883 RepID=A0ABQ5KX64_9EUKA|nr:RNA polymerase subunit RPB4/RPC9 like protein [Aduncisulcus paluster]